MSQMNDFFIMFRELWPKLGCKKNAFSSIWETIYNYGSGHALGKRRDYLWEEAEKFVGKDLNRKLQKTLNLDEFTIPGLSRDGEGRFSEDNFRVRYNDWCKSKRSISDNFLVSFSIVLCILITDANKFFSKDYPCFEDGNLPTDELFGFLSNMISFDKAVYLEKAKTDEAFMLPFILTILSYCNQGKNNEDEDHKISAWLEQVFNERIHIENDGILSSFQLGYYENLWSVCKTIDVRDMVGAKLSSINDNVQISNLYIVPPFSQNGVPVEHPINSNERISQLVVANFNPKNYFPTLQEWIRYGCDISWDDYSVMKNHGDYVQLMFPSSASKGHDTYDLYHDSNGRLTKIYGILEMQDLKEPSTIRNILGKQGTAVPTRAK